MNMQEEVEKIRTLQNLTGGYSEVALENIQAAPFIFIEHLKDVETTLGDTLITIDLIPKRTIRSWFYRTFFKKRIIRNLNLLSKYIIFWMPKTAVMPKIQFNWKYDGD